MQNIKLLQTNIKDNLFFKRREFCLGGVNQRNASSWSYSKLAHRKIGLCKILAKINHIAYTIQLSAHFNNSNAFNVKHLMPYYSNTLEDKSSKEEKNCV
jgi:hypothetical protein